MHISKPLLVKDCVWKNLADDVHIINMTSIGSIIKWLKLIFLSTKSYTFVLKCDPFIIMTQ